MTRPSARRDATIASHAPTMYTVPGEKVTRYGEFGSVWKVHTL
jgi:hypothetical protein